MVPGQPDLLGQFLIKGLVEPTNNISHEIYVHHYSNGGAVLHLPLQGADDTLPTGLDKNYSHPGLKVSYTTRGTSTLSRDRRELMTTAIGGYWAGLAHTTSKTDYIRLEETGHTANFYFRIIPG